jgi:hypothetical protein
MRFAERWPELEAKAQGLAHLTFEDGLKLLAGPGDQSAPDASPDDPRPLDDWRAQWREAGVWFPAATGRELRQWMYADPIFGPLMAASPDEDDDLWYNLLLLILVEPAAGHLVRTGKHLLPPPSLRRVLTDRDWFLQRNEVKAWQIRVEMAAGRFFNWCEAVGISYRKRFKFPEEPRPEALKAALRAEQGNKEIGDGDLAEMFGVPAADLPAALTEWMHGHFYGFICSAAQAAP